MKASFQLDETSFEKLYVTCIALDITINVHITEVVMVFKKHQPSCTQANATARLTRISDKSNTKIIIKLKRNIFFLAVFFHSFDLHFFKTPMVLLVLLLTFGLWK